MAIVTIPFDKGFAPDLNATTPGIFVDTDNIYPTPAGFRPFPSLQRATSNALFQAPMGAFLQQNLQVGGANIMLGTQNSLWQYQADSGDFIRIPNFYNGPSAPGPPTSGYYRSPRWRFTMFGSDLIALNPNDPPQLLAAPNYNTAVALGGCPPQGSIIEAVGDFVLIFDSAGNDWNCSGIGSDQSWTPDLATQAANGVLADTPGPIVGARVLGPSILVYKQRAVYLGQYAGPPTLWDFSLLSADVGTVCDEAIVTYGTSGARQAFMGFDNFYICDGSLPVAIPNPLWKWFFQTSLDARYAYNVWGTWNRLLNLVIWYYPSVNANPAGSLDRYVCWQPEVNRWTTGANPNIVEAVVEAPVSAAGAIVYSPMALFGTALMLSDYSMWQFSGPVASAYVTTGDIGDGKQLSFARGVRPIFNSFPANAAAELTPYYRWNLGDTQLAAKPVQLGSYGWFPVRQAARYQAAKLRFMADCEITGMQIDASAAGVR